MKSILRNTQARLGYQPPAGSGLVKKRDEKHVTSMLRQHARLDHFLQYPHLDYFREFLEEDVDLEDFLVWLRFAHTSQNVINGSGTSIFVREVERRLRPIELASDLAYERNYSGLSKARKEALERLMEPFRMFLRSSHFARYATDARMRSANDQNNKHKGLVDIEDIPFLFNCKFVPGKDNLHCNICSQTLKKVETKKDLPVVFEGYCVKVAPTFASDPGLWQKMHTNGYRKTLALS